jgi:hypothetical protein
MNGSLGMGKHRKSGSSTNSNHFTGAKGGKRVRRKGTTKKERRVKRKAHVNKYRD